MNVAMSADGKISSRRRESFPLGSPTDRELMDILRARADAVVIGASTLRHDGWAIRVRTPRVRERRVARGRPPHPLNVVLTTRLDLPAGCQFFTHARTEKLVITTRQATPRRVQRFSRLAEVAVLPRRTLRVVDVVHLLEDRGVKRLLIEGGGELNYSFFEAGLVDELYLTVTPRIIGGRSAPTPVDGTGFLQATHRKLTLVSSRRRGDEVFLKYRMG